MVKILITCSGIGSRMGEFTNYTNKSLLKIGDKFVVDYILDLFKNIKNVQYIITLGHFGDFVKQYLILAYPNLNFIFVKVDKYSGPGSSLVYSLLKAKKYIQEPFIYITCDTIILDNLKYPHDYKIQSNKLYLYKNKCSQNYASVICQKNTIKTINDKNSKIFDYIYLGKSEIFDYQLFWNILQHIYDKSSNCFNKGDVNVYRKMLQTKTFYFKIINQYFDAGNINVFQSYINKNNEYDVLIKYDESITFHHDKVIKFFYNKEKNLKRIKRFQYLTDVAPKILNYSDNFHVIEKINSRPISENNDRHLIFKLLTWSKNNLWKSFQDTPTNFKTIIRDFYYVKTMKRIKKALEMKIDDYKIINGVNIGNIDKIISQVDFNLLCNENISYNFHGDFILDNILSNSDDNSSFKLIDWREDFGGDLKHGDIYYDLAKLKHNIFFNHKNIEQKLYKVEQIQESECVVDLKCNYNLISQINDFEKFVEKNGFNNNKINILMSLIWINMAPLHEYPLNVFLFNFGKYNLYFHNKK